MTWPIPSGCLLALFAGVVLWIGIITLGQWAVSFVLNIVGAK